MSTILDVAKLAGVSRSTVSRVISGNGVVKSETRDKILHAIENLNYSPSYFAQGIKTGKTKMLAMLIPDYSNLYYGEMYRGIEQVALENGYMVMICNTDKSSTRERIYAEELRKREVDGIIYNTYKRNKDNIDYFTKLSKQMPVIFMDYIDDKDIDVPYVLSEGFESSKKAARYLVSKGKRRIGYIRVPPYISVVQHRYEGYKQGLIESGIEPDEELVYQCPDNEVGKTHLDVGFEGALFLMNKPNPPDAIMTSTDIMAVGAIKYLNGAGYKIPGDVSVVGFDDIALATIVEPSLTTISQPTRKIGEVAARILLAKINGENDIEDQIIFEPEFIVRGSTD
ncbi:MAG: LacI family DNA-binding transcriptional regulator [Clostridia bacterium]|nr:LacI family DNA-binding transcriptional regulator [Clostridia bacterium]MBN2882017.1 LacI family DNA-binding transcriptional regulator [Clostridia bacterium]